RWAALAILGDDGPEASWVTFVPEPDFAGFLIHVSRLAPHTRHLLARPRASLAISEREQEGRDPFLAARVSIHAEAEVIARESADYPAAAGRYIGRLPESEPLFGFGDFVLFRLRPARARFVAGFGRIFTLDAAGLRRAAVSGPAADSPRSTS
nr:pyridoxamine 5'-phosphate oxidase family protein [Pseudomonadota bacterium]